MINNTSNAIDTEAAAAAVSLTYQGGDRNAIDRLATGAGVSVTYAGGDDNYLALVRAAISAIVIACIYALDATLAQIQGIFGGTAAKLAMSNGNQTGSYTLVSGLPGTVGSYAAPANFDTGAGAPIDLSTGIVGVEWALTCPSAFVVGGIGAVVYSCYGFVVSAAFDYRVVWQVSALDDGTFSATVKRFGDATVLTATGLPTAPAAISLSFNANTSTFAVAFDGVTQTLIANGYTPSAAIAVMNIEEAGSVAAALAGTVTAITLITTAASMTGTFTATATDPCGTTI